MQTRVERHRAGRGHPHRRRDDRQLRAHPPSPTSDGPGQLERGGTDQHATEQLIKSRSALGFPRHSPSLCVLSVPFIVIFIVISFWFRSIIFITYGRVPHVSSTSVVSSDRGASRFQPRIRRPEHVARRWHSARRSRRLCLYGPRGRQRGTLFVGLDATHHAASLHRLLSPARHVRRRMSRFTSPR